MLDQNPKTIKRRLHSPDWENLFRSVGHPILILDPNFIIIAVNPAMQKTASMSEAELIGKKCHEIFHGSKTPALHCPLQKLLSSRRIETMEIQVEALNRTFYVYCAPVHDADGEIEHIIHISVDITSKIEAKKALNQKEERYRQLFEHMTSGVAVYEAVGDGEDFIFREFNRAAEQIEHIARKDILDKRVTEVFPGVRDFGIFEIFQRVWRTGQAEYFPTAVYKDHRDSGSWRENWVYKLNSGEIVAIYNDITERIRAEESREQELEISQALAAISEKLIASDYDIRKVADLILDHARKLTDSRHGYVSAVDSKTRENIGYTLTNMVDERRVKDRKIRFSHDPAGKYPGLFGHSLNTLESFFTNDPTGYDGAKGVPEGHIPLQNFLSVPVALDEKPAGQIALANKKSGYTDQDIDIVKRIGRLYALALKQNKIQKDKQQIEAQLLQAQKLEAIGTLAGGIAHDFNNILSAVLGYTEISLEEADINSNLYKRLKEVLNAGKRARNLVEQILTFSRQGEKELIPIEISGIIREALRLLRATLPTTIEIKQSFETHPAQVMANPTQIHQVIMNLCTNAAHSMEGQMGILEVRVSRVVVDQKLSLQHSDLTSGEYLKITISDTGSGIAPDILPYIFDPFFTTKGNGKGTGLGLSTVIGIIKLHKGGIMVASELGKGSAFDVYLPSIHSWTGLSPIEPPRRPEVRGQGRILIVDDEEAIAAMLEQTLTHMGYEVTAKTNSIDLLNAFKAAPHEYDAVITDMTMPQMTGERLAIEIKKIRPEIPVILNTGFSEKMSEDRALELGIDKFLMKPIGRADISNALKELLEKNKGQK